MRELIFIWGIDTSIHHSLRPRIGGGVVMGCIDILYKNGTLHNSIHSYVVVCPQKWNKISSTSLTLSRRQTKVTIFGRVERRNLWMLYWRRNSQNHASRTSATTLILTLSSKSMCRWNLICKGFILSHFGRVACVVHHGLLSLPLCIYTIGINT
jgi:hypothetical protein